MPRPHLAVIVLLTLLVVAGCSGENSEGEPADGSSVSLSAADTLVETALQQLKKGDEAKAQATFENVLELDPSNVYAHYNLGLLAQDAGNEARANKHYDTALKTDPKFTSALYNKGILLERNDLEAAADLYQRAIDINPDLAAAHMRLGFALLQLGQTGEAEKHLSTGVELDPSMANVKAPSYD